MGQGLSKVDKGYQSNKLCSSRSPMVDRCQLLTLAYPDVVVESYRERRTCPFLFEVNFKECVGLAAHYMLSCP